MTQELELSIGDKAFNKNRSVEENLHAFAEHGFTHIHFAHAWRLGEPLGDEEISRWKTALTDAGIKVLDVHGNRDFIHVEDASERRKALDLLRHRLELTARFGCGAMVYHVPTRVEPSAEVLERFLDGLAELEPVARDFGVCIALENHFRWDMDRIALPAAFDAFDRDYIGFTLDPGHGNYSGNLPWLLDNFCDRLAILHLNDNDGKRDRHWLPASPGGTIDWQAVTGAIAASPYDKPLQLEVRWHQDRHEDHEAFLRLAHESAVRLHEAVYGGARVG